MRSAIPLALAALPALAAPTAERLGHAFGRVLTSALYKDVDVSIVVAATDGPTALYSRDPDRKHAPASVVKMFPTAAALARLGPDHRFVTRLRSTARPEGGILKADLLIEGSGDPSFSRQRLAALAERLVASGLRRIEGDIVYDDSVFDTEEPRYGDNARHLYAPPSGLNLDANRIDIRIVSEQPPVLDLSPPSSYASLTYDVRISPSMEPGRPLMTVERLPTGDRYRVKGVITAWDRRYNYLGLGVTRPGLYCATVLKDLLRERGVAMTGGIRRGETPPRTVVLAEDLSPPLAEILGEMNRESNNVAAESLNKALGAAFKGRPGTRAKGVEVIREFLVKEGGLPEGSFTLADSSGLSPANAFSAAQVVHVLRRIHADRRIREAFMASLAVQGNHPHAMNPVPPPHLLVQVKTGTLSAKGVNTVAGYVTDRRTGEVYAFAIFASRRSPGPLTFSGTLTNPLLKALVEAF